MKGSLLVVKGTLQKRDDVTHVVAGRCSITAPRWEPCT
jgi:hypothetical protein